MKVEIILTFWMQFWVLSWVINLLSWIYEAGFFLSGWDFRINLTLHWVMTNVNFVIIGNLLSDIRFRLGIWMKAVTSSLNWLNFREHKTASMYVDNIMLTLNMSLETSDWLLWDLIFGQIECLITSTIYSKYRVKVEKNSTRIIWQA